MLNSKHEDDACRRCLADLEQLVAAALKGEVATLISTGHLDACPACAGAFARQYELSLASQQGVLPNVPLPTPDFSFLVAGLSDPATPDEVKGRLRLRQIWERLATAVRRTRSNVSVTLDAGLRDVLAPVPSAAVMRSGGERYGERLLVLEPESATGADVPFGLAVYADGEDEALCLVEITLQLPSITWPDLAGYPVTLTPTAGPSQTRSTDAWGVAAFAGVARTAVPELQITVAINPANL